MVRVWAAVAAAVFVGLVSALAIVSVRLDSANDRVTLLERRSREQTRAIAVALRCAQALHSDLDRLELTVELLANEATYSPGPPGERPACLTE